MKCERAVEREARADTADRKSSSTARRRATAVTDDTTGGSDGAAAARAFFVGLDAETETAAAGTAEGLSGAEFRAAP